jgi:hypothetical protein
MLNCHRLLVALVSTFTVVALAPIAHSQQLSSPERAAMLDRLIAVLPAPNSDPDSERAQRDEAKRRLAAINPGHEAASGAAFDDYADCLGTAMNAAAPLLVRQAADRSLSDADVADFVDFYSGQRYRAYLQLAERRARGERLTADESRVVHVVEESPASRRFTAALGQVSADFPNTPEGQRVMAPCVANLRAQIQASGLNWF